MDLSFQEKSLWLLFVSLVAAFGFYFVTVLPTDAVNVMPPGCCWGWTGSWA